MAHLIEIQLDQLIWQLVFLTRQSEGWIFQVARLEIYNFYQLLVMLHSFSLVTAPITEVTGI